MIVEQIRNWSRDCGTMLHRLVLLICYSQLLFDKCSHNSLRTTLPFLHDIMWCGDLVPLQSVQQCNTQNSTWMYRHIQNVQSLNSRTSPPYFFPLRHVCLPSSSQLSWVSFSLQYLMKVLMITEFKTSMKYSENGTDRELYLFLQDTRATPMLQYIKKCSNDQRKD